MKRWIARVRVMPRSGLLDPQGSAVEHALTSLGFSRVGRVRVGRTFEIQLEGASEQAVREDVKAMCDRLVANPVTEDYTIDQVEAA